MHSDFCPKTGVWKGRKRRVILQWRVLTKVPIKIPREGHFTKHPKIVKVIKNRESLRICHNQEEPKET